MRARLKELWARFWPFLVVALVAAALGFLAGHRGLPARVEEKSHVEEKTDTTKTGDVKAAERIEEDKKVTKRRVRIIKRTEFRPDGTKSSETTTETGEKTDIEKTGTEDRHSETNTSETSNTVRTEDHYKLTEYRKNWRVSALVGTELTNPFRTGSATGGLAYGLHAEVRLFSTPVWLGVWGMGITSPLPPGIGFNPGRQWLVGGSLGFEF